MMTKKYYTKPLENYPSCDSRLSEAELAALYNVAQCVMRATTVKRLYNGRGRPPVYEGRIDEIAGAARQLAEMVLAIIPAPPESKEKKDELPF